MTTSKGVWFVVRQDGAAVQSSVLHQSELVLSWLMCSFHHTLSLSQVEPTNTQTMAVLPSAKKAAQKVSLSQCHYKYYGGCWG